MHSNANARSPRSRSRMKRSEGPNSRSQRSVSKVRSKQCSAQAPHQEEQKELVVTSKGSRDQRFSLDQQRLRCQCENCQAHEVKAGKVEATPVFETSARVTAS